MLRGTAGWRAICVAVGGSALALALAMPANAAFHLIKISEVGQGGEGQVDYVELQMYASGQNLVGGKTVKTYDDAGLERSTFTLPAGVPSGETQRTILIVRGEGGGGEPASIADFLTPDLILTTGGAVCFGESFGPGEAIDCMAYGAFAGFAGPTPSPVGTPAPEIPPGGALQRSLTPGCATLLEEGDDTDSSAADFSLATPSPRNNATAPTEVPCAGGGGGTDDDPPQTTITKAPDRLTKARAKLKFTSSEAGSTFRCSLDGKRFKPCDSPFRKRVDEGRHRFKVFAIDAAGNADPTPDKAKFRRVE